MYSGFDFGTSNCAIGVCDSSEQDVQLAAISHGTAYMPSSIYTLQRDLICESVALEIKDEAIRNEFMTLRETQLLRAQQVRRNEGISNTEQCVFVGKDAVDQYLSYPDEGFYIKSPKSFLGASELQVEAVKFFEDIVTKMMLTVKHKAEQELGVDIEHTVIGRPVNFQGVDSKKSNPRALSILSNAAARAGFKSLEYLYEPIAAGIDLEPTLSEDKIVLVVDIGGGTSDCSMVKMGPSYRHKFDRSEDILGFSGQRIGGNDFDIKLAERKIMPLFGMGSTFKDGTEIPNYVYREAVQTNNIGAQTSFYSQETGFRLKRYLVEGLDKQGIARMIKLRQGKQIQKLIQSAEQAKIKLSTDSEYRVDLAYIEAELYSDVARQEFSDAINPVLEKSIKLIDDVINQAGCQPDIIYLTGGAARATIISDILIQRFGVDKVKFGDYYGSVAKGLTLWAKKLYR